MSAAGVRLAPPITASQRRVHSSAFEVDPARLVHAVRCSQPPHAQFMHHRCAARVRYLSPYSSA